MDGFCVVCGSVYAVPQFDVPVIMEIRYFCKLTRFPFDFPEALP